MRLRTGILGLIAACGGGPEEVRPDDTDPPDTASACGTNPVPGAVMDFLGIVTEGGAPAAGATVTLRDLGMPGDNELGRTTSGDDGTWRMDDVTFTAWPDCWVVVTEFRVSAFRDGLRGDLLITDEVGGAWLREEDTVDITDKPIVLRD